MKNYLFVCGAGLSRSPTAALAAKELAYEKRKKILTEHVGLYSGAKISEEKINSFDRIFVMNSEMEKVIREEYHYKKPIINLCVRDIYGMHDPELFKIMKSKLKRYI